MPELMSPPMNFSDSGRSSVKAPLERPSFSHTCSLLSQYLKEKGSFGDLSLGITCNPDRRVTGKGETLRPKTTMDLLPRLDVSEPTPNVSERNVKPMDLFPHRTRFGSSFEDARKSAQISMNQRKEEPEISEMTIFYKGKVHVFHGFSAEKAREVMLLAGTGAPQPSKILPPSSTDFASTSSSSANLANAKNLDLPIARKASLHRFLEKRKERISSVAPYPLQKELTAVASLAEASKESKSWLGLAASPSN